MEPNARRRQSRCPVMGRRSFLGTLGASALAIKVGVFDFASELFGGEPATQPRSSSMPRIRAAFLRPNIKRFWMGWPGACYDIDGSEQLYRRTLTEAATRLGVQIEFPEKPLYDAAAVTTFLEEVQKNPPDGVILNLMDMGRWGDVNRFVQSRGEIPTVVFSPMGTAFTGHLGPSSRARKVFVGSTQDVAWLGTALKMFQAMWRMKTTRICVVSGNASGDRQLEPLGTTLHQIPRARFPEELAKVEVNDDVRAVADFWRKQAKRIVEPQEPAILNAAKNYIAARRILAAENCQGITMDCLGLVGSRIIPCPPCMAWQKLNDEGSVGCCEADTSAAISLLLSTSLFGRPGFMQDPAPNTVNNTLMGAHCSCPTKLDGLDAPPAEQILRSHSESEVGVSPQVLWRIDQRVTIMKFEGPGSMIVGTGKVVRNIDTPPSGGCRTSVVLELDGVPDARDTKGFHQLFLYGNLDLGFRAYAQLAGITVSHI